MWWGTAIECSDPVGLARFYSDLADMLRARRDGTPQPVRDLSIPTGVDGLVGVRFVEATLSSHAEDAAWVTME